MLELFIPVFFIPDYLSQFFSDVSETQAVSGAAL